MERRKYRIINLNITLVTWKIIMKNPLATATTTQELLPAIEVPSKSTSETPKLVAPNFDIICTNKVLPKTQSTK